MPWRLVWELGTRSGRDQLALRGSRSRHLRFPLYQASSTARHQRPQIAVAQSFQLVAAGPALHAA